MGNEIKVSVICNVYNHGKYLRDALEGFVSQKTNFAFEVLIHDDASTDNSADIIREYEFKYPELIKPIYQAENQYSKHISINRTFQIPRTQGKYIAFCEGDDYWTDPMKLQKQVDFLEANPEYSMCACSTIWLDMRTMKNINLCRTETDRDVTLDEIILETKGRIFQLATIVLKSEIYKSMPDWTKKFRVGDLPLEMYAAMCGKIRMLADTMAVYRNHAEGSWTSRIDEDQQYKTKMFTNIIEGLRAFDAATDYQYNAVVSRRIKEQKYRIARSNRDFKALRSGELREVYLSKNIRTRMSDALWCKAPAVHSLIMKILLK